MPLQDADKPSRRQILAEERKKHGAYDPVRLSKLIQPQKRLQRRSANHGRVGAETLRKGQQSLVKRDVNTDSVTAPVSGSKAQLTAGVPGLPPAPAHSGAVADSLPPPAEDHPNLPSDIPDINYGSVEPKKDTAAPRKDSPASDAGATHNDTATEQASPQTYTLTSADTSARDPSSPSLDSPSHITHRMIGLISGLLIVALVLVALVYFCRRYRQKLTDHYCTRDSSKKSWKSKAWRSKAWRSSQRLGSIDGLKSVGNDGGPTNGGCAASEDLTGSSDVLVTQVSSNKGGPFDRAISNMFSEKRTKKPGSAQSLNAGDTSQTVSYPSATMSKIGLVHQRSLDSIAEVQEPPSRSSSQFPVQANRRDSNTVLSQFEATPKRLTWSDLHRPMTSPGRTSTFGTSTPSSAFSSPENRSGKKISPARPQSAKGGDIEMTRQGSKLVIRNRPSTATLRRPLSSAGSSFRSALRKTRGGDGGEQDEICIETEGIVSRGDEDYVAYQTHTEVRNSIGSPTAKSEANDAVYELGVPDMNNPTTVKELRSHFSNSTLRTHARESFATSLSETGSFSFEIKDAVRRCAPVALKTNVEDKDGNIQRLRVDADEVREEKVTTGERTESFVRDLDWDLRDCILTNDSSCSPLQKPKAAALIREK